MGLMIDSTVSNPPTYLDAVRNPLGLSNWATLEEAKTVLSALASHAVVNHNHSVWWNYIHLHNKYVEQFAPTKRDILPGFPDMDTAVKTKAPSVYNWYYAHKGLATTPWNEVPFVDLSLSMQSGFVDKNEANAILERMVQQWTPRTCDARLGTAPPLWLLASAWRESPHWVPLLNMLHGDRTSQPVGIGQLDRTVLPAETLWQWQCMAQKDISFLSVDQATRALDTLRLGGMDEYTRSQCEVHFLGYYPQCKTQAEIAFALGAPLWLPQIETLQGVVDPNLFEAGPEALHAK